MKKTYLATIISLAFVAFFVSGCSLTSKNKSVNIKNAEENPVVNEAGKTYLQSLHENIAAFDKSAIEQTEKDKVVMLEENGSIYYFAANGKRYIFPTEATYKSWFKDYAPEKTMPLSKMEKIPLGGNVTARPGTLIQTSTDFKTYLVKKGELISPVDEGVLIAIFGEKYKERVLDIPNWYFTNYNYSAPISTIKDYPLTNLLLTVDSDKGFNEPLR